jgi:anti-sigma factor RsiW
MNAHVSAWLAAYYDGELHGPRLQQVEDHLERCPLCRAELQEIRKLSALLQEVPLAQGSLSASRFRSQVMLRLPALPRQHPWQRTLKVGWQLAPLGAVLVWVFGQATWLAANLVSLLDLPLDLSRAAMLMGGLNLLSFSPGGHAVETIFKLAFLNLAFNALIAVFLLGWLASWWVMRRHS